MALTASNPFDIGTQASNFSLLNVITGEKNDLNELKGRHGTVIMFICNHCPFVVHVNPELVNMANEYLDKGISFIAISSNNVTTHPQDGPEHMAELSKRLKYPFPYLYDETQEVARAYDAACTPDFYVFDSTLKSVYHGRLDQSTPGNGHPLTGDDLRNALDNLLDGKKASLSQYPSIGCGIKWK